MSVAFSGSFKRPVRSAFLLSCALMFLCACGNPFNKGGDDQHKQPKDSTPSPSAGRPLLRLSGSNTIGAELGPALVEGWLTQKMGATDVKRVSAGKEDEVRISATIAGQPRVVEIQAHGTATGFTGLGTGLCDIAMASREIKPEERAKLETLNLGDEKVIGLDAVVVIVHESNGATAMTKPQVKAIFTGEDKSRSWHVHARDDKSGTFDTFKAKVLGSADLVATAQRHEDSRALAAAVASDPDAIGFIGLPYAVGVKKLQIQEKGALPIEPSVLTVKNESYPLFRRLLFYVPARASAEARQFVDFVTSEAGQEIVDKIGFVGLRIDIKPPELERPAATVIPGADKLTTMFYFRSGSSDLDARALQDRPRVVALLSKLDARRGVILVGFADNVGSYDANIDLSKRRAKAVADSLAPLGIVARGVTGFGQALPIADNGTDDGRSRNRRVEIWIQR